MNLMQRATVVLTGASSGLGACAAQRFHALGAEVIVVGRDVARTRELASRLNVAHHIADFSRLDDVRRLADEIRATTNHIDVLASNAGGIAPRGLTVDGIESTLQVNAIAPWLLMTRLAPLLIGGRVVSTSSRSHLGARIDRDRLEQLAVDTDDLSAHRRYARAKLVNGILLREWGRRHPGIDVGDFHPGIMATDFGRYMGWVGTALKFLTAPILDSADDGAARLVQLAMRPQQLDEQYFVKNHPGDGSPQLTDGPLGAALWQLATRVSSSITTHDDGA